MAPVETSEQAAAISLTARAAVVPGRGARPIEVLPPDLPIIVTIDGPAGTGKSSVGRALALRLGLDFLDTGAMYRAAAAIVIDERIPFDDAAAIVERVAEAELRFDWRTDPPAIIAFDRPMGSRIRDEDVTRVVSPLSALAPLRRLMVTKQRRIAAEHPRLVSEGRDQGSVVFPDALVKFYLFASAQVRAERRAAQLREREIDADVARLRAEIEARDASDMTRAVGPLTCPDDAVRLDTSELSFDEVVDALERVVRERATSGR